MIGSKDGRKKLVLLYSHGGGYLFGEPLMYMSTYKRWIKAAARENIELTIVSVDYRKPPVLCSNTATSADSVCIHQALDDMMLQGCTHSMT